MSAPGVTFSIDYLIGEEAYLGQGYGKTIVERLTDVVRQTGAEQIVVQPEKDNAASCRALAANGYAFDPERAYFMKRL